MLFALPLTWVLGTPQTLMYYVLRITYYILSIKSYPLRFTPYTLPLTPTPQDDLLGCFCIENIHETL